MNHLKKVLITFLWEILKVVKKKNQLIFIFFSHKNFLRAFDPLLPTFIRANTLYVFCFPALYFHFGLLISTFPMALLRHQLWKSEDTRSELMQLHVAYTYKMNSQCQWGRRGQKSLSVTQHHLRDGLMSKQTWLQLLPI